MPSVSKKQHNFMAAVANNPSFAKKAAVPQSVGQEFMKADTGRKFGTGSRPDLQKVNKPATRHGKSSILARGGDVKESKAMMKKEVGFMKKAGAPKSMIKHEMKEAGMKKMASGGITKAKMGAVPTAAPSRDGLAKKGTTKGTMVKMAASKPLGMKRGGKTC